MSDPLWMNADAGAPAYAANELRQAMALALAYDGRNMGGRQGVRPGGDQLQVSLDGSTITVQPGVACVDPGLSTPQGPYWVAIGTPETHTLTPADATNPRKDIVILRVYDHDEDAGGLRLARTEYLVGAPSPSPAEPATPAGSIRLATIDVPAVGGGLAAVTDRRPFTVSAGGILPVRDGAAIAGQHAGMYRDRADTKTLERCDGSAWEPVGPLGLVAWAELTAASSAATASDVGVLRLDSVQLRAGRAYRVWTTPLHLDSTAGNDEMRARIRYSTTGTAVTSSPVLPGATVHVRQVDANVSEDKSISTLYIPVTDQVVSILLCVGRIAGTGSVSFKNSDGDDTVRLVVDDDGRAIAKSGVVL